jgi:hypothetical protein
MRPNNFGVSLLTAALTRTILPYPANRPSTACAGRGCPVHG